MYKRVILKGIHNMGCACTRLKVLFEEDLILKEEYAIGFQKHKSSTIDMIIRKYAFQETFNLNSLVEVAKELGLHVDDYDNHDGITEFFKEMSYNSRSFFFQLLVFGILNGKSSDHTKAYLLFQVFDPECQYSLNSIQVREMIHTIFCVCIEKPYYLVSNMIKTSSDVKNLKSYIKRCKIASSYCEEEAIRSFLNMGKSIKMNDFVEKLLSYKGGYLLLSNSVRLYAYEYYTKNKPQKPVALTRLCSIKNELERENGNRQLHIQINNKRKSRKLTPGRELPDLFNLDKPFEKNEPANEVETEENAVEVEPVLIRQRRTTTVARHLSDDLTK